MQLIRIDQHHAALWGQMLTAAMAKTLCAMLNHGEHKTFMHMRSKALLTVAGFQQLHTRHTGRQPKACLLSSIVLRHNRHPEADDSARRK